MRSRMPWVKWSPSDFLNGVVGLDPFAICAYTIILNLIYDNGGPIRADEVMMRKIARRCSMRFDHFEKAIATLIAEGKLIVVDGVMSNARAELELGSRAAKVAKLVSNFGRDDRLPTKNDNHFNGIPAQKEQQIVEKPAIDKKQKREEKITLKQKPVKSTRIDPRRKISDQNILYAKCRGLRKREIEHEWELFVRHYAQLPDNRPTSKSNDWDMVWESWCLRKAAELGREPLIEEDRPPPEPESLPREIWVRSVEIWRTTSQWHPDLGPTPDKPGYRGPPDLVRPS